MKFSASFQTFTLVLACTPCCAAAAKFLEHRNLTMNPQLSFNDSNMEGMSPDVISFNSAISAGGQDGQWQYVATWLIIVMLSLAARIMTHKSVKAKEALEKERDLESAQDIDDARDDSVESQLERASDMDWQRFAWHADCLRLHEGSMKTVGCLRSHPKVALASVTRGTGEDLIRQEVETLNELAAYGIRTITYCKKLLDVPSVDPETPGARAQGYLLQYFDKDSCFFFEEGEPGTEDYVLEPMRKLKLLADDEGDWAMNRDTIRVLKENHLASVFMEDLTAIVKLMLDKGIRIVDFQGVLGKDGHFYVADPLRLEHIPDKVNKHLLAGVFMSSTQPPRQNKPKKAAFVDELGIELGVAVPDLAE